jgi:plastocyanin
MELAELVRVLSARSTIKEGQAMTLLTTPSKTVLALGASAALTLSVGQLAMAQAASVQTPVELAVTNSDPVVCQPDPLLVPAGEVVALRMVNNSINSTIIVLDDLLEAQIQTQESVLAEGATSQMVEGYNLGPGQDREIAFATVDPGIYTYECRSPVADAGGEVPDSLSMTGLIRVE